MNATPTLSPASASRDVTDTPAARLAALHPKAKLVRRDITAERLPHLDDITLRAITTKDPAEAECLRLRRSCRTNSPRSSWRRVMMFGGLANADHDDCIRVIHSLSR